jgi:tRNA (guanine-N7-)-methyltransferase
MSASSSVESPLLMRPEPPRDLYPWFLVHADVDANFSGRLGWKTLFGNENPVELDVGSGRGLFLFNAAVAHPDRNYLGMEIDYKEGRRAARRLQKRSLPNARVLGGDAKAALANMVAPGSVDAIRVYFPDPWWKQRHRKRRIFNEEFLDLASRALKPGGELHSWTDVEEYFGVITELVDARADFQRDQAPDERSPEHDMDYQTSFERKGRKAGTPIHRALWRRV